MDSTLLEHFTPDNIGSDREQLSIQGLAGGRLSMLNVLVTYFVKYTENPMPAPAEVRKAFKIVMELHQQAAGEKIIAQWLGRAKEVKLWNVILENLDVTRKCLQSINISHAIESKVAANIN